MGSSGNGEKVMTLTTSISPVRLLSVFRVLPACTPVSTLYDASIVHRLCDPSIVHCLLFPSWPSVLAQRVRQREGKKEGWSMHPSQLLSLSLSFPICSSSGTA